MRIASVSGHGQTSALPPGPRGVPYFGSYFGLKDPLKLFSEGRDRFGDIAMYRFGPHRFVVINDPVAVQHVLVRNHRNYVKSRSYQGLRLILGNGLITSEGDFWRRQRRLAQPAFHKQHLQGFATTMESCTNTMLDQWDRDRVHHIDLFQEMMRLTLRIVGHTLFGTELAGEAGGVGPDIGTALRRANQEAEAVVRLPLWLPTPSNLKFHGARKRLDRVIGRIIDQRRASPSEHNDLLGMLMSATDEDGTGGMTNTQLRDEVMTLFLAGHETTATLMSWTLRLLTMHPQVQQGVRREVADVVGDRRVEFSDLAQLEYTDRVIRESMRLYPPVWMLERQALAPDEVGGFDIPKDTMMAVCTWSMHRHPSLWDQPLRFDPSRFSPERSEHRHRYAYLPFGAGPRVCIGLQFALMEAKLLLATMLQRYRVHVQSPEKTQLEPAITLRPKHGMPAMLERIGPS